MANQRKETCEQVLLEYINTHDGWHRKVDLYLIAYEWSPESAGRALRKAEEKGLIKVEYYDSRYAKNLAKYASLSTKKDPTPKVTILEMPDGSRRAVMN